MKRTLGPLLLMSALALFWGESTSQAARRKKEPQPEPSPSVLPTAEFKDTVERDYAVRNLRQLEVTNIRGGLLIHGWALDKIRVRATRVIQATDANAAKSQFEAMDVRFQEHEYSIELAAHYGRGLEIEQRLQERKRQSARMEMEVWAPSGLKLQVWSNEGAIEVQDWNREVEIRTSTGAITLKDAKSQTVSLLCSSCPIDVRRLKGSIRCMGGDQPVSLEQVRGDSIFVETTSGDIRARGIQGEQWYVSKGGSLTGRDLMGRIEFHLQKGSVQIDEARGFASGKTETGAIRLAMREWKFLDKAFLESLKGSIEVGLPVRFSGELDLWSVQGKTALDFQMDSTQVADQLTYGPEPANRLRGRVGDGGEQFRMVSREGNVSVYKLK